MRRHDCGQPAEFTKMLSPEPGPMHGCQITRREMSRNYCYSLHRKVELQRSSYIRKYLVAVTRNEKSCSARFRHAARSMFFKFVTAAHASSIELTRKPSTPDRTISGKA